MNFDYSAHATYEYVADECYTKSVWYGDDIQRTGRYLEQYDYKKRKYVRIARRVKMEAFEEFLSNMNRRDVVRCGENP
jgi:hypothetical protein